MQEILLKIKYFERGLSKSLKKVNFIFSLKPSPFNDQVIKNKRDLELVTAALQIMKQVQKNSFIRYVLSDQV